MFPGAGASVYYNEAGEVLGWDGAYEADPFDYDDWNDRDMPDDDDPFEE